MRGQDEEITERGRKKRTTEKTDRGGERERRMRRTALNNVEYKAGYHQL